VPSVNTASMWTPRQCGDYMRISPAWVRVAITDGVVVADGRIVKLEAETVATGTRHTYRVHVDKYIDFLKGIGWHRLPARRCDDAASKN
jgi:hypothetical protein